MKIFKHLVILVKQLIIRIRPEWEVKRCYKKVFGHAPNLTHPKDLIEKIYWLELNTDTSMWTKCTDKYQVRDYITSKGFAQYLPKLYAKWDNVNDISFNNLPNEFILKTNNGCGTCYIVKDKDNEDITYIRKLLKTWLNLNDQGYSNAQLHYLGIKPCIIAEELLPNTGVQKSISPNSIIDYKVWCFNGVPECILVVYNRTANSYFLDLYDVNWNRLEDKLNIAGNKSIGFNKNEIPPIPCLKSMLKIASALSSDFKEVRVDFYVVNGEPVIGELTFSSGYGYFTSEYYRYLGDKIDIEKINKE